LTVAAGGQLEAAAVTVRVASGPVDAAGLVAAAAALVATGLALGLAVPTTAADGVALAEPPHAARPMLRAMENRVRDLA
jgi:hypothetical protein